MKAVINEKETPVKPKYPCLKQSKYGVVVLFYSYRRGTVVAGVDITDPGQFREDWEEDDCFTPFSGSITISND